MIFLSVCARQGAWWGEGNSGIMIRFATGKRDFPQRSQKSSEAHLSLLFDALRESFASEEAAGGYVDQ